VDSEDHLESRGDVRIARGVPLRSLRLGISGKADVVEFHRDDSGVPLAGAEGKWVPFPVEYKRGKPKQDHCDVIQLCAQAICLEEMLDAHIPSGALFYGRIRRRFEVAFDSRLRDETASATARLHELIRSGTTPKAVREPKCEKCSLIHLCIPDFVGAKKSAQGYLEEIWKE
ncbi:CRISPR-associated protein Cas4, partial [Candidatus Sumerlaeota bacterium]|nr:CRISPR-associated protein Cas4 [Candidatus Sumerlaeota bacterium]